MVFYDANLSYGTEFNVSRTPPLPCRTIAELDDALERAGVTGGLVRTLAADMSGVVVGNRMLADDLKTVRADLYGMYTLVPRYTNELPSPEDLPGVLKAWKMPVLRMNPRTHRFLPKAGVLREYLGMAADLKIPVMLDTTCGITLDECYDLLCAYPTLTAILAYSNIWPADRYYRPFLSQFPNLRMELSSMITDQGIEDLVRVYGAQRLLFGSRFPSMYIGGQQLMLRCAEISDADKKLIAGENLRNMIAAGVSADAEVLK
ncbi:MAG: hypothetical protein GX929_03190 [Clostridiales bacterium]|jgi:hypothetical protein|nr:hypothetical protein [Clostridiales bacterium]